MEGTDCNHSFERFITANHSLNWLPCWTVWKLNRLSSFSNYSVQTHKGKRELFRIQNWIWPLSCKTMIFIKVSDASESCRTDLFQPCISHLFHTVPWTAWRPVSAQEPAWSAAATTSGADSQTCTWNSARQLFWTASRGPPNPSTSYLWGMGCKMGNITFFVFAARNTSAVFYLSSLYVALLGHPLQTGRGDTWAISLVT